MSIFLLIEEGLLRLDERLELYPLVEYYLLMTL